MAYFCVTYFFFKSSNAASFVTLNLRALEPFSEFSTYCILNNFFSVFPCMDTYRVLGVVP